MGVRVGIDTGGTFTDLVAVDDATGRWYVAKVPSNPGNPVAAITAALGTAGFDPGDVSFVVVGTTIGINAVLTRQGARVLYLTTKGFEDVPYIQRINRKHHYDFHWRKPEPLMHRPDSLPVAERVDEEGGVLEPIDLDGLGDRVAERLSANGGGPVAVAVCLLFSYLNPDHELATRDLLRERFPHLPVSLSHEIAPIWREYERGTAAILDAYLKPTVNRYVEGVTEAFRAQGAGTNWSLLKSNGGHAVAAEARNRPGHILLSGIAGGAIGGAYYARQRDAARGIVLDMGGTSCDVCMIVDGHPLFSSEYEIEFGLPVAVPTVSTKTIGAGGGSIGWIDPGGFLQVGPQSAGADPGPACYGQGGDEPTLTDANVALGRLNPDYFLGGTLDLDPEASRAALGKLAGALGGDEVQVASSMIRTANENMANAVRIVTVEEGVDPREYALIAMGGAGPTHAAEIAEAIGMDRVIVPLHPGLTSAFGALAAEVRVDEVKSVSLKGNSVEPETLDRLFAEIVETATAGFRAQGSSQEDPAVARFIAMRYEGQNYEQEIPVPDGPITAELLGEVLERYHQLHHEFYGYRLDAIPVELVRLMATATAADTGALPALSLDVHGRTAAADAPEARTADVHFAGGFQPTPVIARTELIGSESRQGPLIVESLDTTVVVPPGWTVESDEVGILELRRSGGSESSEAAAGAVAAAN